ncbi:uncharacterized protein V6R79_022251 [Siganus canaliculatus]
MNERERKDTMAEVNVLNDSQRRRSPRLSSPQVNVKIDNKMALGSVAVKRSITVRKIAPRKTVAPSEHNKENTPRQQEKQKVSTPGVVPAGGSSSSAKKKKKTPKAAMPSPILPSSPPPRTRSQQATADPGDVVWSQKVRRSYSRLSDKSISSPDSRENLFGFEKLQTPEVAARKVARSHTGLEVSGSLSGLNSFTSLLDADECGSVFPEPDINIPGVTVVKEKRKRMKVQQIDASEIDAMAAKMNAEFEEAEEFELIVE